MKTRIYAAPAVKRLMLPIIKRISTRHFAKQILPFYCIDLSVSVNGELAQGLHITFYIIFRYIMLP